MTDADDKPVQYVSGTIKKDRSFYVSDSNGFFCERLLSKIKAGDTILFSAIGYKQRELVYDGSDNIVLIREFPLLPEIVLVKGEGEVEVWGTRKTPSLFGGYCSMGFSDILVQAMGRVVYPEGRFRKAEILSVSFYNTKGEENGIPVRLRIYTLGKDSLPVADYLMENIINDTKRKGWVTFDLKDKGLHMPEDGLSICLEMFADSEDLYHMEKVRIGERQVIEKRFYGFGFGMESGGKSTVMKFNEWTPWQFLQSANPCGDVVCKVKVRVWR
ncbi:MAG: hypothetical protein JNM88_12865 [Chitinophagaceae bacterium]|nr:hypothetical protein [Chitinophagaceae bacterium]